MKKVICPYCGRAAEFIDSKEIYGRSYGMVYLCQPCDAYVGVHKGTDRPLGRPADKALRKQRNIAHAAFDTLWKSGKFGRKEAYAWLSHQLGLPVEKTHIAMFNGDTCKRTVELSVNEMKGENFCEYEEYEEYEECGAF
jgi:hypothetical protein